MDTYLTYSSFITAILTWLQGHPQLATVKMGTITELTTPLDSSTVTYPYCFVLQDMNTPRLWLRSNSSTSDMLVELKMSIMDQCRDGATTLLTQADRLTRQSNMIDIARDFITYFNTVTGDFGPYYIDNQSGNLKVQLHPFSDKFTDKVTGVEFTVQFVVEQPQQRLYIPGYPYLGPTGY
jgi:hypothetical protein